VAILRQENCKASFSDRYPCLNVDNIRTVADQLYIRSALVVINDLNYIDRTLDRYRSIFPTVILIKHQIGTWGLSSLKPLDFADVMGFQVRNNLLNPWAQFLKRFIDITVTALCLLFFSPFLAFIWLVIRLDSPGNPYYRQMRLGRNGRVFYLLKFRSMRTDADQVLQEKLAADPALRNEWNQYQKLKDDPRITRVGYWLRKFSLDELPQLWNVFVGEMSLVGPRPMMIDQEKIYGEEYRDYIRVTPGMTGLWQISGRNQTTFTRRAMLDCEYIQKWSIWLDIYILMMTIKVVLFPQGAY